MIPRLHALLPLVASVGLALAADASGQTASSAAEAGVIHVPGGHYTPLYALPDSDPRVEVEAFGLDAHPVTVRGYLAFVRAESRWRRSAAPELLVGGSYLEGWTDDKDPRLEGRALDRPVTRVSWFAARAYCAWAGGRLPTTDQWEYAASGGPDDPDAFNARVLALYQARPPADALPPVGTTDRNRWGLTDLHGLVWEWTSDFNNQMLTGAGRDDRGLDRQLFCAAGSVGTTDPADYAAFLRYAYRASLDGTEGGARLGFRCARSVVRPSTEP